MVRLGLLTLGLCAALISPAMAQAPEACRVSPEDWFLIFGAEMDGFWIDSTHVSLLNGEPLPLPAPETVGGTPTATGLRVEGGDEGVVFDLELVDFAFTIDPPAGFNLPDGEEIGLVIGCDVNQLPRFYGEQDLRLQGMPATVRVWAIAMSSSQMLVWSRFETDFGTIAQQSYMTR
jgi:hypothetical protein